MNGKSIESGKGILPEEEAARRQPTKAERRKIAQERCYFGGITPFAALPVFDEIEVFAYNTINPNRSK